MEFLNFPIVALAAALVCLIGVSLYAITQRSSLRSRDEQLVVARAQAYAMLELSQAGVLFLDREHKLMGEASAAAPELLGHTCGAGTAFVQVIAELVPVNVRRDTVAYLESLWKAEPTALVDATQNPLQRVHSGSRHLALRFSRLVVDGRVHHIIVSIERISAPRVVPHTIEVPVLDEETFAKRLAGETGTRRALNIADLPPASALDAGTAEAPVVPPASTPAASAPSAEPMPAAVGTAGTTHPSNDPVSGMPPMSTGEFELGPMDVTSDSVPQQKSPTGQSLAHVTVESPASDAGTLATTITPMEVAASAVAKSVQPDVNAIIDLPDPRLNEVLQELLPLDALRLDLFLGEAREKAGQLRAILKLPAREPQAFREKLVLILELIRGIHARAERLPLPSVNERAEKFEAALNSLRDKQTLSGNDFLPLAVKLDDLLSHLAIQGEVVTRLREWREKNGIAPPGADTPPVDATQRSVTGTTIRQPRLPLENVHMADANPGANTGATTVTTALSETQKAARLSDLSKESLEEMASFLADMYQKRVSLVCVGLEDVPLAYRRTIEKLLGQFIHNAIRHGIEAPADRAVIDKPETGTVAVQFLRAGADGYQLSVQDDGRGLEHDKIRAEAVRQGVMSAEEAARTDARKLATLIFRAGFTTVGDGGARGIGMDVVRDLVNKAGGRVGIATKPGEYTRFRVTLPHEKKASDAAA
ncbi:MAG TPA: ATP-binding protein [Steroidobacteraceae bacterium]